MENGFDRPDAKVTPPVAGVCAWSVVQRRHAVV